MPYKAGFDDWVLDKFDRDANGTGNLFKHQTFVKEFMKDGSPYRGLLLYHGLGVGKTRSAIEIAKANKKDVVVMLPASLRENFMAEIKKSGAGESRFTFVSYNGFNMKNVGKYVDGFFDNKLVIIDEVHNFISRCSGSRLIGKQIYQALMNAKGLKIVALSGTPIINRPLEISFLLNLIHGYIYTTVYKYNGYTEFDRLEKSISAVENVSTCFIDTEANTISVSYLPEGFKKREDIVVASSSAAKGTSVVALIKASSLSIRKETNVKNTLFPFKEEDWDNLFVDYDTVAVQNEILFSRRAQGLVSYYEAYDPSAYPEQLPLQVVSCPMSKTHFGKYLVVRQEEISKEQKAARFRKTEVASTKDEIKSGNVYRSFSRAVCNFAFPNAIKRPYPSTLREFKYDVDDPGDIEEGAVEKEEKGKGELKKLYDKKVAESLAALEKDASTYLSLDGLEEHGPKMKAIIENVGRSAGTTLVYSMFRNVEGLAILAMAFREVSDYVELTVKKTLTGWKLECSDFHKPKYIIFTDNREETEILLAVFNSEFDRLPATVRAQITATSNLHGEFVKVLMITQSGSEGISLKNVRQVHVTEPYWNNIRMQQVAGRAIRAMSHVSLPKAERKVETFLYITVLNEEQKEHALIKSHDAGLTSDGYVYNIAIKKSIINDKFLQLLKNTSVDCRINKKVHGTKVQCFKAPYTNAGFVYYVGDVGKDVPDKAIKKVVKNVREYKSLGILFDGTQELVVLANPDVKQKNAFQELANETFKLQPPETDLAWNGIFFKNKPAMKNLVGLIKGKAIKWIQKPSSIVKIT